MPGDHAGEHSDLPTLLKFVHTGHHPLQEVRPGPVLQARVANHDAPEIPWVPLAMPAAPLPANLQADNSVALDVESDEDLVSPALAVVHELQGCRARGDVASWHSTGRCHGEPGELIAVGS